jgi:hypothetical protein
MKTHALLISPVFAMALGIVSLSCASANTASPAPLDILIFGDTNSEKSHQVANDHAEQMQTRRMTKGQVKEVYADMGYRGHNHKGKETIHVDRRRRGNIGRRLWKRMKHRAAVEPTTGHCKNEHRMERNRLWAQAGDAVNALLSAASMNFGKLLAAFLRYFIRQLLGINPSPGPLCLSRGAKNAFFRIDYSAKKPLLRNISEVSIYTLHACFHTCATASFAVFAAPSLALV